MSAPGAKREGSRGAGQLTGRLTVLLTGRLTGLLLVSLLISAARSAAAAPRTPSAHSTSPRPPEPARPHRETGSSDGFGRWDMGVSACQLTRGSGSSPTAPSDPSARPLRCQRVRLDQQLPGLLSVRFMAPPAAHRATETQLVFAGVLAQGSPAMECHGGTCEPKGPMRVQVSAVAENGFNPEGTLLQAQLARGQCLWEERRLRCEASAPGGPSWTAEASR